MRKYILFLIIGLILAFSVVYFQKFNFWLMDSNKNVMKDNKNSFEAVDFKTLSSQDIAKNNKNSTGNMSNGAKLDFVDLNKITEKSSQDLKNNHIGSNGKVTLLSNNHASMPTEPKFNLQWGIYNNGQFIEGQKGTKEVDINILSAWDITKGSSDVIVGILDTGIDINHPDLKNSIFINKGEIPNNGIDDDENGYIDDVSGWDFYNYDNKTYDSSINDAHGTSVAGIISAQHNNIGICGVSPNVKILPLKFIDRGNGIYASDAIEAIKYGKKMGVTIFNCSWAMDEYYEELEQEMKNTDAIFVCAADNLSRDLDKLPIYPACFNLTNIISVASINNNGNLAKSSNFGSKVTLAAPGIGIYSTTPENQYMFSDGTSIATPFVTGVAVLIKSKNIDIKSSDIIKKIKANVTKVEKLKNKVETGGFINAYNCIK